MGTSFGAWPSSALAAADRAIALLVAPPAPLVFDARGLGNGLPARPIVLDELRRLLLASSTSQQARDACWHLLIAHARRWGPAWVVAAVGMALPGLVAMAGRLCAGHAHRADDIEAELLAGFLEELRHGDLTGTAPYARLCWAGWRRALVVRRDDPLIRPLGWLEASSASPARPYGHPDLVLGRAVAAGYITGEQAELISATRLGGQLVEQLAAQRGLEPSVLRMRRRRGELALLAALTGGNLDPARPTPATGRRPGTGAGTSRSRHAGGSDSAGAGQRARAEGVRNVAGVSSVTGSAGVRHG